MKPLNAVSCMQSLLGKHNIQSPETQGKSLCPWTHDCGSVATLQSASSYECNICFYHGPKIWNLNAAISDIPTTQSDGLYQAP